MVDTKKLQEELPIELLQKGICITDEEANNHEVLQLTELEGGLLNGKAYEINAKGVTPSLRRINDGIAVFGVSKTESNSVPDVILNLTKESFDKLKNPNVFLIYYRRDYQKFYLESVNENKETFFIFVLLDRPHILTTETIVASVQNYNFKIKTSPSKEEVIVEYGQSESLAKSVLNHKDKSVFYIGRKPECDIVLNETQFSREQFIIYFENGNWFIKDGGKENPSTNGTWLYVEKKYQINDSFTFKIGPAKMKVNVVQPNENTNKQ